MTHDPAPRPNRGRPLDEIETWIFDLDNTLYPSSCNLFAEAEARMATFIVEELKIELDIAAAHALRRRFFLDHGTTLRGLMLEHGIEPRRFLDYVHDIDLSPVQPDPALDAALAALPGRKFVFTNGTDDYARRILQRLGVEPHFTAVHDITACSYFPKPDPSGYRVIVERYGIDPRTALMIEDMARNLAPAASMGMTTAWVRTPSDWARQGCEPEHIHHVIDELGPWLAGAARKGDAG